ncbi:alpha/beta fold hydrolase [Rhodococcoides trifolii]|uniref:alpha/beta fold hydrolase n=1 Tax=Rhodococcoides trifolii TaxID=908250 RepID=UPI001E405A3B|nr:alpha/beta fold hydrolase [Rhodococcus trifolii]
MTDSFHDLDAYIALPRLGGLSLAPDGTRLVTSMSTPNEKSTKYVSALWELDSTGRTPARRLTRSEQGESGGVFTASGDLLFLRATSTEDDASMALWLLPAGGGDARQLASRGGSVGGVVAARTSPTFVVSSDVLGGSEDVDARIRAQRKDTKVSAILHSGYPVRYWDHDLGPATPHLFTGASDGDDADLDDVTTLAGGALREAEYDLAHDGSFVVSTWSVGGPLASLRSTLVRVDIGTGARTVLVDDPDADVFAPAISPDSRRVAYLRESVSSPDVAPRTTLHVLDVATGVSVRWASELDRWPTSVVWLQDSSAVAVTVDDNGRGRILLVDDTSTSPVTSDDFVYTNVIAGANGVLYAMRASYAAPPHPVRIDTASTEVAALQAPCELPEIPGVLVEVSTQAEDGTTVRAWLARPAEGPSPLLLWVHGGPLSSWNSWSWRWNPWLMVAAGYAVLLPDPALSTGYGQDFVQRGWGRWGKEPYTDLMAITDAAELLPEVDATRTAAMGGSFGGYMANWIAGHTDRFSAIVTHASLWALDQFGPTTDSAWYWAREMTPEMAFDNSPHLFVSNIVTPMLVIHGDRDYRVPIGEGVRLWYELLSESGLPADDFGKTDHRFLLFPNENHWVLTPQHAKVWYQVVLAFLSEHVLGEDAVMPEVLGG